MARSGYTDDYDDNDTFDMIRWRGAVAKAIGGRRGQAFLLEMYRAMEGLPEKKLITDVLQDDYEDGAVCSLGAVGRVRGIDMTLVDEHDYQSIADAFGISCALAQEIMCLNDECGPCGETPELRFQRMRKWIIEHLKPVDLKEVAEGGEHDSHGSEPPSA